MNVVASVLLVILVSFSVHAAAAEPLEIPLWPDLRRDGGAEKITERGKAKPDRSITNVRFPTATVYLPENAAAAAVIICPGGAYGGLAIDKEGHDVARWLNTQGVAGIVLKYRLPHGEAATGEKPLPLQDAQRTIRMARAHAAEWKLDPKRIGIMGFSAGGHLAATVATRFDAGKADAAEPCERQSSRPDFTALIYPVVSMTDTLGHKGTRQALLGANPTQALIEEYSNELHVTAQTPPTFLVHAKDDGVKVENSLQFGAALKKAGVPCEPQIYDTGGHGYGMGVRGGDVATWPERFAKWLSAIH